MDTSDQHIQEQMAELARGTQDLLLPGELETRLKRGTPLKVKTGFVPTAPDLPRARALANALPSAARTLTLSYDPAMRAARALAERVAVNARDAGLTVQTAPQNPHADLQLAAVRLTSLDPAQALAGLAAALGLPSPGPAESPETLYESERKLLDSFRAIPLFHLPMLYGVSSRVRVAAPPQVTCLGDWRFDNIWLAGNAL